MARKIQMVEEVLEVELLAPAADAAGRTSGYLNLAQAQRATLRVHIGQGNAATILLSILQATDEEGTGSKAISVNVPIWANVNTAASDQQVRQSDGVTYTTDAGLHNKIVTFQIDPEYLDQANGFNSIGISTGASNAANITEASALIEQRYAQPVPGANYSDVV